MHKIRKVVIPAAGYGTRFLPVTKAQPKEMLPIIDKPIIQYVVEEAVTSGIEDVIIVTSWQKRSIEDHFDNASELEKYLKEKRRLEQLAEIKKISEMANFIYVRQKGPYGNASPVMAAKHLIGNEPFAVLWGDEFIYSQPPRLKQIIEVFEEYGHPTISAIKIEKKEDLSRYGIAKVKQIKDNVYQIISIIEKPRPEEAPSQLAAHGGYIFTPEIFKFLENLKPGKGGELWLVDAITNYIKTKPVYACEIKNGKYYDTGNKLEYLKANIDFALQRDDLKKPLKDYLKTII